MTYKWVSALSYDIDDDLQVGITPVLPPSIVNNVPLIMIMMIMIMMTMLMLMTTMMMI